MRKLESPLRRVRRARSLNQEQFAGLIGVTQESLSKAERGKLRLSRDVQELAATILGVSRRELFPTEEAMAS